MNRFDANQNTPTMTLREIALILGHSERHLRRLRRAGLLDLTATPFSGRHHQQFFRHEVEREVARRRSR